MKLTGIVFSLFALADARMLPTTSPVLSPVLKLRGGSLEPTITNAVVGLNVASGLFSYISPNKNLEAYGSSSAVTVDQTAYMRYVGALQLCAAATIMAGEAKGADFAASTSLSAGAIALLMATPGFEALGTPKEPVAAWIVGLVALGKLAREGTLDAAIAMKIALAVNCLNGLQFYLAPQSAIDMYKVKVEVTNMGKSIFKGAGMNLFNIGLYLFFSNRDGHMAGITAFAASGAVFALKMVLIDAEKDGFEKKGPAAWAAIQGAIAYMAYQAIESVSE